MSVLSQKFLQHGYQISREMSISPVATRLWAEKDGASYIVDFVPGQTLLLSVGDYPGWKKRLTAAREICAAFMGAEPLCRYDAKPSLVWTHFMEWDLIHPEHRLRIIVNRGEDLSQIPFRDLQLFGDYRISDFEDAALKRAFHNAAELSQKFPGVYGKDPGPDCDVVRVLRADEFGLFLEYNLLELTRITHHQFRSATRPIDDAFSKLIHGATITELRDRSLNLALDFVAVQICEKVGIQFATPTSAHRLRFDEVAFVKWFNAHSERLTRLCPDDASMSRVFERYQLGEDISAYAPK